jgi:hypothetical protein
MSAEPRPSKVPPHAFDEDATVPADFHGRRTCRCGLVGKSGDQHHPVDAEPLSSTVLPPVPAAAREFDTRRLGEREEEAA